MAIYDKPVWRLMYDMVEAFELERDATFSKDQAMAWFAERYPEIKQGTISGHLTRLSTNAPSRVHHRVRPGDDDLLFQVDRTHYRLYDPQRDPRPIYPGQEPPSKSARATGDEPSWAERVVDPALKARLSRLGSAPLDTVVREAGVVLEDRLRQSAGECGAMLHGADLVRAVLSPERGLLVFSAHAGEQEGVRMLYQGVMQFVRNPAMHRLVDYPPNVAWLFVQLIDCLLQLLTELEPQQRGDVTVQDVRRMLTRRSISRGQRALFEALYQAGEGGLSADELAAAIGRTRPQLTGVLGALGRRIYGTDSLEGKGGIEVVLDISPTGDESWRYCMRPVLRRALEAEGIV